MRRRDLHGCIMVLLLGASELARGAAIVAVRVWPAADYTRVTIESDTALKVTHRFVAEPPRLAIDIEGIDLNPALKELVAKVRSDDPYIAGARVGQNAPGVVRLVLDLKQAASPQVFSLAPVAAAYQHRLVLDLYPAKAVDPLQALIAEKLIDRASKAAQTAANADPLGDLIAAQAKKPILPAPSSAIASAATPAAPTPALAASKATGAVVTAESASRAGTAKPPIPVPRPTANTAINAASGPLANPVSPPTAPLSVPNPTIASDESRMDRFVVIALDPGHGGEDPGAIGPAGTREKDVVLAIALKLRKRINATSLNLRSGNTQMRAMLTRDADFFVPLQLRVQKAQRVQADLFISIHADAFTEERARGASVFALSERGATSASARYMAQKENAADSVGGVNVAVKDKSVLRAILDMSTTAQINDSLKLGSAFLGEIGQFAKLHKPRVEQAGFAVLKAPDIPSVLVETAFISNAGEEQRLRDPAYQDQLADALMRGIVRYFERNPPQARSRTV